MAKEDVIEFSEQFELLPNAMFRVKLDNDHEVLAIRVEKCGRIEFGCLPVTASMLR